jgi:hypothetical protein
MASGEEGIERLLQREITAAFGSAENVFRDMKVNVVFKGVTYESLSDPKFIQVALKQIPSLDDFHEEFDAARARTEDNVKKAERSGVAAGSS